MSTACPATAAQRGGNVKTPMTLLSKCWHDVMRCDCLSVNCVCVWAKMHPSWRQTQQSVSVDAALMVPNDCTLCSLQVDKITALLNSSCSVLVSQRCILLYSHFWGCRLWCYYIRLPYILRCACGFVYPLYFIFLGTNMQSDCCLC